jgi:hypothetical protein
MDLSFVNELCLEDLELDPETQAALALIDLSDYRPTPDATTMFNPSPAPNHITISLASTESSTTDSDSPILHAPQPARVICHHPWHVPNVTPQSPSTEQSSQTLSPAGLAFTDPLIADEWHAHSAPTHVSSHTQNSPILEAPSLAPATITDHRLDTAVNTPTSTTRSYRSAVPELDSRPCITPARYIPLSELSHSFAEPDTSLIYTNNSQDLPARPLMDAYNPRSRWHHHAQFFQHPIYPGTQSVTILAMVWSGLPDCLQYMCLDSLTCLGQDQTSLIPVHFCIACIWFFLFFPGSLASSPLWYPLY